MRRDLFKIIKTFISLSSGYPEDDVAEALKGLKNEWSNLTSDEILEMDAIIKGYRKITIIEDEEDVKEERNYDFDVEPRGGIRVLFKK